MGRKGWFSFPERDMSVPVKRLMKEKSMGLACGPFVVQWN